MAGLVLAVAGLQSLDTVRAEAPAPAGSPSAWTEACTDWDDWDKAGSQFRVHGNTYYVGTCGITSLLVVGDAGHVLIDGGTEAGADAIAANIEALGFSLKDVKVLLHSHEHFDHAAGLAELQRRSGARLLASAKAAPVLRTGHAADDDPQAGMHDAFPAARVDDIVHEGVAIELGTLRLTPIATPGHTPGALSWHWQACDADRCHAVVYADSLSPMGSDHYRFSDHPDYVKAYRAGLRKLADLDCAILLTPHPSASHLRDRLSKPGGLVDTQACRSYANAVTGRLDAQLASEVAKSNP